MFPTAVCMFRSGERIFRSGERTYRSAEHRLNTCYGKIIIALVYTLRQLLLHIHYHYPHTIIMLILRYLISDRRCDSSHLTTQQHYFVTLSVIFSCQTSAVIGLNPTLYNDKVNQCTEVIVPMTHCLRFTNNTAFLWSCLTQSCIHKKTFISEVFI